LRTEGKTAFQLSLLRVNCPTVKARRKKVIGASPLGESSMVEGGGGTRKRSTGRDLHSSEAGATSTRWGESKSSQRERGVCAIKYTHELKRQTLVAVST